MELLNLFDLVMHVSESFETTSAFCMQDAQNYCNKACHLKQHFLILTNFLGRGTYFKLLVLHQCGVHFSLCPPPHPNLFSSV